MHGCWTLIEVVNDVSERDSDAGRWIVMSITEMLSTVPTYYTALVSSWALLTLVDLSFPFPTPLCHPLIMTGRPFGAPVISAPLPAKIASR